MVIGAGPAGSLAALLLARGGWAVTLVEQHRFPRDKVCGECLSALGVQVLARYALLDGIRRRGAVLMRRAALYAGDGSGATIELPREMLGISRQTLDEFLLEQARAAGVTILQPARCESLDYSAGRACATIRDLQSNAVTRLRSAVILVADGKGALPGAAPAPTGEFGIKSHWTDIDCAPDRIELFGCRGCYGGLAPIEDGRWNAAFAIPATRLHDYRGDIDALFANLMRENAALKRRMARSKQVTPWLASPLPRFAPAQTWMAGVIPIGNAAAAIEPIGGEGMGLALRSAELAALALTSLDGNEFDLASLQWEFRKLWRAPAKVYRMGAAVASSRRLSSMTIALLHGDQSIVGGFLRAMGK
jgi:menaquinone-9 beta-reductase